MVRSGETRSGHLTLCLQRSPSRLQGLFRSGPSGSSCTELGWGIQGPMPSAGEVQPQTTTIGT
jgi:hypothetical protein